MTASPCSSSGFQTPDEAGGLGAMLAAADPLEWAGSLRYGLILVVLFLGYRLLRRLADGLATAPPSWTAASSTPKAAPPRSASAPTASSRA